MRISQKIALAVAVVIPLTGLLTGAGIVRADEPLILYPINSDPPVLDPPLVWSVRTVNIWPGTPPGDDPGAWRWFPFSQQPPDTPEQDFVLLTDADSLEIGVPWWQQSAFMEYLEAGFTRTGNQLCLEGYWLVSHSVMTTTEYPPNQYVHRIGSLPAGQYTLTVRSIELSLGFYQPATLDFAAFRADPAGYAAAVQAMDYRTHEGTYEFTVVPEPGTSVLLVCAAAVAIPIALLRRGSRLVRKRRKCLGLPAAANRG